MLSNVTFKQTREMDPFLLGIYQKWHYLIDSNGGMISEPRTIQAPSVPKFSFAQLKATHQLVHQQANGRRSTNRRPTTNRSYKSHQLPKPFRIIYIAENGHCEPPIGPKKFSPYYDQLVRNKMIKDLVFTAGEHDYCYETIKNSFSHLHLDQWQFFRATGSKLQSIATYNSSNFDLAALVEYILSLCQLIFRMGSGNEGYKKVYIAPIYPQSFVFDDNDNNVTQLPNDEMPNDTATGAIQ